MRDDFTKVTKDALGKRVNLKCSNPDCGVNTTGPNTTPHKSINIGKAAHICAASKGGPRYSKIMTTSQRKSINNGIWLCSNCADLIDRDEEKYTVRLLHEWKNKAEVKADNEIGKNTQQEFDQLGELQMLITARENKLATISTTIKRTRGNELMEKNTYIGVQAFPHIFKVLRLPYYQHQSYEKIDSLDTLPSYLIKFFNDYYPELKSYFQLVTTSLEYISQNFNKKLYVNMYTSRLDYYEKIILYYYVKFLENPRFIEIIGKMDIMREISDSDLNLIHRVQ